MMIRIKCDPAAPPECSHGIVCGEVPGIDRVHVYAVGDDGVEHEITSVTRIVWCAEGLEPNRAWLEFVGVELNAEAEAEGVAA